ncbi:hypothetical protein, partial [Caldibacillus thermoamylovorans]|uniref:hypothetical protein n=1 Tax=Caldibacillus thermoamylovorans TaxID=35841 RepID=UPI001E3EF86A
MFFLQFCPIGKARLASMSHFFHYFKAICPIASFYGTVFHVLAEILSHREGTSSFYEPFFSLFQSNLSHSGVLWDGF